MKKTLKNVTISLTAMLMIFGSTYTAVGSANAAGSNDLHGWHVYGDVDNNGIVDINDAILVAQFMTVYKNKHNNSIISVEDAIDYLDEDNNKYYLSIPQAADIDDDGYITEADQICIQYYEAKNYEKAKRCGQPFFIN